jgi:hypothetical protein
MPVPQDDSLPSSQAAGSTSHTVDGADTETLIEKIQNLGGPSAGQEDDDDEEDGEDGEEEKEGVAAEGGEGAGGDKKKKKKKKKGKTAKIADRLK